MSNDNSSLSDSSQDSDDELPKQKKQLLEDGVSSDSEIDPLVVKSRKIEEKRLENIEQSQFEVDAEQQQAAEDLRLDFEIPDAAALQKEEEQGFDMTMLWARIEDVSRILSNFKNLRNPKHSRAEYVSLLQRDLRFYYGYNDFLIEKFFSMFSVEEVLALLDANEKSRPITLRANTLKTRRIDLIKALTERGVHVEPIPWSKVGLQVFSSRVPVGATPEYLAGHYMLQSASSMTAVIALDPKPGERILDMASAPGGKATFIAQLMKNKGFLIANDVNPTRIAALTANLHRLGVTNCIVSNLDGRKLPERMKGFDRVLLDAPCSGSGIVSRDPQVKVKKSRKDLQSLSAIQKELILAAIDCTKSSKTKSGFIVYSTCSVLVEENEDVVQYALRKRDVKLVDTGLGDFGVKGYVHSGKRRFHPTMTLTRRYYPHVYNMDGFFVAKLQTVNTAKGEEKGSIPKPISGSEDVSKKRIREAKPKDPNGPITKRLKINSNPNKKFTVQVTTRTELKNSKPSRKKLKKAKK